MIILTAPETRWECLSCDFTDVTRSTEAHTRYHPCPGLGGLTMPMVHAGIKGKHVVKEREDYINGKDVQLNSDGRPVMSVITVRDNGMDTTVYAPTAVAAEGSSRIGV